MNLKQALRDMVGVTATADIWKSLNGSWSQTLVESIPLDLTKPVLINQWPSQNGKKSRNLQEWNNDSTQAKAMVGYFLSATSYNFRRFNMGNSYYDNYVLIAGTTIPTASMITFPKGFFNTKILDAMTDAQINAIPSKDLTIQYLIRQKIDSSEILQEYMRIYNLLIAVRDHYTLYQTSAYVFATSGMKEKISYLIGRNFLKLMQTQLALLSSSAFTLEPNYPALSFIKLTTMGYLKSTDIVTSDLAPYFKVDDEITGIMNRISAISPIVNGNKVVPDFITAMIGTDVTPTSVPTGKMVVKVINDVLIEADKFYTAMGY